MLLNTWYPLALLLVLAMLTPPLGSAVAQAPPADSYFYNPTFGSGSDTFSTSSGGDDTAAFNLAINTLATGGGGILNVSSGTYRFLDVNLKSNVHLRFDSAATVFPYIPAGGFSGNVSVFKADSDSGPLNNFSIEGTGGKFSIDMSAVNTTDRIRAVNFGHASNFHIANFNVIDNVSEFSALAFGANTDNQTTPNGLRITTVNGVASFGIVENVSIENAHYGYGMTQVQAGNNLLFRNLAGEGGVTLRLETGYDLLQYADSGQFAQIKVDQIYGRNIYNENGQAAVTLSPHTLDQGTVDLAGISSDSSEFAVVVGKGFTTTEQENAGLTPGSFASDSKIRDVTATFGQNAQLHPSKYMRFVPCELRDERVNGIGISTEVGGPGSGLNSRVGPSISAALHLHDAGEGYYPVDFPVSEATAQGFNLEAHSMAKNGYVIDSYDDFEECNRTVNNVNFHVPVEFRDTPNRNVSNVPEPGMSILLFGMALTFVGRRCRPLN